MSRHLQPLAKLRGDLAMTTDAESPDVLQVALASTFRDRNDVVGIPETPAAVVCGPMLEQETAIRATRTPELTHGRKGVDSAGSADAAIAQQNLFAKIAGLGAQLPFVHAI